MIDPAAQFSLFSDMKFNLVDVQNAVLSGGVAVGAIAHLMLQPFGAIIIGSVAGILSTVGYQLIQVREICCCYIPLS